MVNGRYGYSKLVPIMMKDIEALIKWFGFVNFEHGRGGLEW